MTGVLRCCAVANALPPFHDRRWWWRRLACRAVWQVRSPVLLDFPLLTRRRFRDLALEPSFLESCDDASDSLDLLEQRFRLSLELIGERFDVIRSPKWIDDVWNSRLVGENLLRPQRDL